MNFAQATENLPSSVREFIKSNLSEHHLSVNEPMDPLAASILAQAQLIVFLDRRRLARMIAVSVLGMIMTGILGVYYGRSTVTKPVIPVSLPSSTSIDGKGILVMDIKTWKPYAWIKSDKAYFFQ